jgi:hypothetical protein
MNADLKIWKRLFLVVNGLAGATPSFLMICVYLRSSAVQNSVGDAFKLTLVMVCP